MRSLHVHRAYVGIVCVTLAVLHGVAGLLALATRGDDRDVVFNGKMIALLLLAALAWNPPCGHSADGGKS